MKSNQVLGPAEFERTCIQCWDNMPEAERQLYQAVCGGVNAIVL